MKEVSIRLCAKVDPWEKTSHTWFHSRCGETFRVVDIHQGLSRIYEVDVTDLHLAGQLDITRAFVPASFAEELAD
jgi:hypothetical protein